MYYSCCFSLFQMALCSYGRCFSARRINWSDSTFVVVTGLDVSSDSSKCKAYGRTYYHNFYRDGMIAGSGAQVWGLCSFLDVPLFINYL